MGEHEGVTVAALARLQGLRLDSRRAQRTAVWVAVLVATALTLVWLVLPETGTDLAAQQARADFAGHHPLSPLDLRWYSGVQPAAYSVLTPYLAALLGVRALSAVAAVLGAALIAELTIRARVRRPVAAAVWTATACVADVVSGRTAFAVGLVFGAAAVVALQGGARRTATALAVVTTLASPVAGLFLGVVAVSWATTNRAALRLGFGAGVPLLLLAVLVPEPGQMPVSWHSAWQAALVSAAVVVLGQGAVSRVAAALLTLGTLLAFVIANPVGSNAQRLTVLFAGAALLAVGRGPRVVLAVVLAWTAYWSTEVPVRDLQHRGEPTAERAAARQLTTILEGLGPMTGRVEVVPLREHGESVDVSPLARGWLRQVDRTRAALFYGGSISADRYQSWLSANAVEYVALASRPLDWSTKHETALLKTPPAYLEQVHQDSTWTVWRVVGATPIAAGLVSQSDTDLVVDGATGANPIRLHWSRWLTVDHGCVERQGDHVVVMLKQPARVRLSSSYAGPFSGHHC